MYSLMKHRKTNSCLAMTQFKDQNVTKTSEPLPYLILFSAPPRGNYPEICVNCFVPSYVPFGNLKSM